jgi:ABC-2 type transport system ATP-binding protein
MAKHYGDQIVLNDVSFSVRQGEVGLIGPNGAGKTTLLEAVAGLLPAEHGAVTWQKQPIEQSRRRDVLFYVPEGIRPYGDQHVTRVLTFMAGVYRRPAGYLRDLVQTLGLQPVLVKRVDTLSKGYNRRLLLALGFLAPHPVLLMDEPFDGFDLKQTREMMALFRRVAADGRTLVLSIHQLNDAERVCDRFILLSGGTSRGSGTLSELRAKVSSDRASLEDVFLALA